MRTPRQFFYQRFISPYMYSTRNSESELLQDFHDIVTASATPHRVVMRVDTNYLDLCDLRTSALTIFDDIIPHSEERSIKFQLVALAVWDIYSYLVLDLNNFNNDFVTADKKKTVAPIYYVRVWDWRYVYLHRTPQHDEAVAKRLEVLHRRFGSGAQMPLIEDHTSNSLSDVHPSG